MLGEPLDPNRRLPESGPGVVVRRVSKRTFGPEHARRKYRYLRIHTIHYYVVLTAMTGAILVCGLNIAAFHTRSVPLSHVAFGAVLVTSLVLWFAYFWGFVMVMNGHIPFHRLKVLLPHAMVGVLAPLIYTLNISLAVSADYDQPTSGLAIACSAVCLLILVIQFVMGKAVARPEPLRIVQRGPAPDDQ